MIECSVQRIFALLCGMSIIFQPCSGSDYLTHARTFNGFTWITILFVPVNNSPLPIIPVYIPVETADSGEDIVRLFAMVGTGMSVGSAVAQPLYNYTWDIRVQQINCFSDDEPLRGQDNLVKLWCTYTIDSNQGSVQTDTDRFDAWLRNETWVRFHGHDDDNLRWIQHSDLVKKLSLTPLPFSEQNDNKTFLRTFSFIH